VPHPDGHRIAFADLDLPSALSGQAGAGEVDPEEQVIGGIRFRFANLTHAVEISPEHGCAGEPPLDQRDVGRAVRQRLNG
jgi:hypothetical protein